MTRGLKRTRFFGRIGALAGTVLILSTLMLSVGASVARAYGLAHPGPPVCGEVEPLDVVFILDNSLSMSENDAGPGDSDQDRAGWAKAAIDGLIDDLDLIVNGGVGTGPGDSDPTDGRHRVGLTTYSGLLSNGDTLATVRSSLAARNATDTKALVPTVGVIAGTPLKQGMLAGATDMTNNDRVTDFGLAVRQVIIFLSDGRPYPDNSVQRPNPTEIGDFQDAADEVFSVAIGSGGSGPFLVDLVLMQSLDNPHTGSYPTLGAHYANVDSSEELSDFFDDIFQTIACPGTITIEKHTVGGNGTFNFVSTGEDMDEGFSLTTVSGSASVTFTDLKPGSYTFTEQARSGWTLTDIDCYLDGPEPEGLQFLNDERDGNTVDVYVHAGEVVDCVFTNTYVALPAQEVIAETLPPTDGIGSGDQATGTGFGLLLTLLALAGIGLVASMASTRARVRSGNRHR